MITVLLEYGGRGPNDVLNFLLPRHYLHSLHSVPTAQGLYW